MLTKIKMWWQKFKCVYLGVHDRKSIAHANCTVWRQHIFGNPHKVEAVTILKRCRHCGVASAWVTDGMNEQQMSLDYVLNSSREIFDAYCDAEGSFVLAK